MPNLLATRCFLFDILTGACLWLVALLKAWLNISLSELKSALGNTGWWTGASGGAGLTSKGSCLREGLLTLKRLMDLLRVTVLARWCRSLLVSNRLPTSVVTGWLLLKGNEIDRGLCAVAGLGLVGRFRVTDF